MPSNIGVLQRASEIASNKKEKLSRKNIKSLEEVVHSCSTDKMFREFQKLTRKMPL